VIMGPVNMGTVADIGWPDTSVGTFGVVGQVCDVTGTLGKSGRDGGSAATGPGIVGRAPGANDPGIIGQAFGVGDPGDDQVGDGSRRYTCDPNSGAEGPGIFGQTSDIGDPGNGGLGDESRRYMCDSNRGDGLRSYTCNPNNGVRPGRYTSGRNDESRPSGEASDRDDGRGARQPPQMVHRRRALPSSTYDDKRLHAGNEEASDGAAIAGDPMSSTRFRDRPHRTIRLPARFKDFD